MIQTDYTNRYGKNSLFNIVIMFIKMGILLFIANMIGPDWQQYFHYLCWAIGTLTLTLFFQYLVEFFRKSTDDANREVSKVSMDNRSRKFRILSSSSSSYLP